MRPPKESVGQSDFTPSPRGEPHKPGGKPRSLRSGAPRISPRPCALHDRSSWPARSDIRLLPAFAGQSPPRRPLPNDFGPPGQCAIVGISASPDPVGPNQPGYGPGIVGRLSTRPDTLPRQHRKKSGSPARPGAANEPANRASRPNPGRDDRWRVGSPHSRGSLFGWTVTSMEGRGYPDDPPHRPEAVGHLRKNLRQSWLPLPRWPHPSGRSW